MIQINFCRKCRKPIGKEHGIWCECKTHKANKMKRRTDKARFGWLMKTKSSVYPRGRGWECCFMITKDDEDYAFGHTVQKAIDLASKMLAAMDADNKL